MRMERGQAFAGVPHQNPLSTGIWLRVEESTINSPHEKVSGDDHSGHDARQPALNRIKVAAEFKDLLSPANMILLALVAGLGLIGLFGGWDNLAERETEIPRAQTESEIEANPFKLTVGKASWFQDIPQLYRLEPGQRALLVRVDITNQSSRYVDRLDLQKAFRLEAAGLIDPIQRRPVPAGEINPVILRGGDALQERSLQPGLPSRIALIWIQDANVAPPGKVRLIVRKQNYRASALDGNMAYFDAAPAYAVELPVSEMRLEQ